jgi:SAM-dependent methyltransferase
MVRMADDDSLLRQQVEYYRARATEYDEWFLRTGRYDRGEEHRKQWFAEVDEIRAALAATHPGGDALELACGTGLWTYHLLSRSERIVAIDAAREAIEISRRRIGDPRVEYVHADLFSWRPTERFDLVFFGFWLSHVPLSRFADFWDMIRQALKNGGKVFFVDSLLAQESTAVDHQPMDRNGRSVRRLNDGREFEIVKIFHEPPKLEADLHDLGWKGNVQATANFFYYGAFHRQD